MTSVVRWKVQGRVQGVGFRWYTLKRAQALRLVGWVENLPCGDVEVVAQGPPESLNALEAAIREGPTFARVDRVERHRFPHETIEAKSFEVK